MERNAVTPLSFTFIALMTLRAEHFEHNSRLGSIGARMVAGMGGGGGAGMQSEISNGVCPPIPTKLCLHDLNLLKAIGGVLPNGE